MAGRSDIEAGKAYVTTYVKNSALFKGLNAAKQRLEGFGKSTMKFGALLSGLGSAIIAPLGLALNHFMDFGSALADMSARTGESVGSLAELKFAAEQTGASLEDVEIALKMQQKKGVKGTFDEVAAQIAAIEDPAKRTQAALENWGKSGTKLLALVDNLQALRKEARDLGLAPSEGTVKLADDLGDAFDKIKGVIGATAVTIGAALAPPLISALEIVTRLAVNVNKWVAANGALVRTIALVGAGLAAAGAVITVIGATIFGLGAAFGVIATVLAGIGTALGIVLSPLGLIVTALVAGVAAWARFTASGQASVTFLLTKLGELLAFGRKVIGGIGDALMAGDLAAAARVATSAIQLAFQLMKGVAIRVWEDIKLRIANAYDEIGITARASVAFLGSLWNALSLMVSIAFPQAMALASKAWTAFKIAGTLAMQGLIELANKLSTALGIAVGVMKVAITQSNAGTAAQLAADTAVAGFKASDIGQIIGQATSAAVAETQKARDELAGPRMEREAGRAERIDDQAGAIARAQAEFDDALQAARAARAAVEAGRAGEAAGPIAPAASELKSTASSTFSGAALLALGRGGGVQDRMLKVAEEHKVIARDTRDSAKGLLEETKRQKIK